MKKNKTVKHCPPHSAHPLLNAVPACISSWSSELKCFLVCRPMKEFYCVCIVSFLFWFFFVSMFNYVW